MKRKIVIAGFFILSLSIIFFAPGFIRAAKLGNNTRQVVVKDTESMTLDEMAKFFPSVQLNLTKEYKAEYTIRKTYYRKGWWVKVKRDTVSTSVISKDAG
jgi:hypothetical protein